MMTSAIPHQNLREGDNRSRPTPLSQWNDPIWLYPGKTPRELFDVRWNFLVGRGRSFTDPDFDHLLRSLREVTYGLFHDPQEGTAYQAATLHQHSYHWRDFIRWMDRNDFRTFAQVRSSDTWTYLDDWIAREIEEDEQGKLTTTTRSMIGTLRTMWKQRPSLETAGADCFTEAPFDNLSASEVLRRLGNISEQRIPPLPDEVALPTLAAAVRMIGVPAEDVINVLHDIAASYEAVPPGRPQVFRYATRKKLLAHHFAVVTGEEQPWRSRLRNRQEEWGRPQNRGFVPIIGHLGPIRSFARLVADVRGACAIVVQGLSGIRVSELSSIEGRWNAGAAFPTCISVRTSESGLNEIFFVAGKVIKEKGDPQAAEWLIGMRPKGSEYIPLPVRAICIIWRLYEPWRNHTRSPDSLRDYLFLGASVSGFQIVDGNDHFAPAPLTTGMLREDQRTFIARYVDLKSLPDVGARGDSLVEYRESRGTRMRTAQWRKSFAQYAWRTDSRMLPAISAHFKHMQLSVAENAYIGNDPGLLGELDSQRRQTTAKLFRQWAKGGPMSAGLMSRRLDQFRTQLKAAEGDSDDVAAIKLVDLHAVKIFFSEHGHCFITADPMSARCHQIAGTASWKNRTPSYAHREPSVCLACPCYYVDRDHEVFWIDRLAANTKRHREALESGAVDVLKITRSRITQSKQVLRAIGVEVDPGDAE